MFDLGWTEIAFILTLALVVIGPKDLPKLARAVGKLQGKIRRIYQDMQFSLKKLELEVDRIENPPPANGQPDYFHLLPEHVRKAMEMSEPVRDAAVRQKIDADFEAAMATLRAQHEAQLAAATNATEGARSPSSAVAHTDPSAHTTTHLTAPTRTE